MASEATLATIPQEQPQCRLLQLPPELRSQTFEHALYMPTTSNMFELSKSVRFAEGDCYPNILGLLKTCRQIHEEAEAIFYAVNKFKVSRLDYQWSSSLMRAPSENLVPRMSHRALENITEIAVAHTPRQVESITYALKSLRRFRRLQHVKFVLGFNRVTNPEEPFIERAVANLETLQRITNEKNSPSVKNTELVLQHMVVKAIQKRLKRLDGAESVERKRKHEMLEVAENILAKARKEYGDRETADRVYIRTPALIRPNG